MLALLRVRVGMSLLALVVSGCAAKSSASAAAGSGGAQAVGGALGTGGSPAALGGADSGGTQAGGGDSGGYTAVTTGGSVQASSGGIGAGGGAAVGGGGTPAATGGTATGGVMGATGGAVVATGGASPGSGGGTSAGGGVSTTWPTCSQAAAQLDTAFATWESAYVADCTSEGRGKRVVGCGAGTCSEAMGYGMLIAVNRGRQDLFDDFATFVRAFIPVSSAGGTMAGRYLLPWSIGGCDGVASDYNNATDGDLDIAMSLLQAEVRWPGYGYRDLAIPMLRDILTYNTTSYAGRRVLLAGDSTLQPAQNGSYPSYFAPGYYRVFAQVLRSSAEADGATLAGQYDELTVATYELFASYQGAMDNKLWPEYANLDGTLNNGDQGYWWNACRTPWRIATDWAWFGGADAESQLSVAAASNPDPYAAAPEKNSAFVGGLTFLHMPAGNAAFESACAAWFGGALSDGVYFQDSLKLLYLLLAAGQFPAPV